MSSDLPKITRKQALDIATMNGYRGIIPGECSEDFWNFLKFTGCVSMSSINAVLGGSGGGKQSKSKKKSTKKKKATSSSAFSSNSGFSK